MARFEVNDGREDLLELDEDKLYLVEGTFCGFSSTNRDHVSRLTLSQVFIRPYDTSNRVSDLPVIAVADHLNSIRKNSGLEHSNLREGSRCWFIGQPYSYTSVRNPGILRHSLKLFRGIEFNKELTKVEKRLRNCVSSWGSTDPNTVEQHLQGTLKLIERLVSHLTEDKHFIPWITKEEATERTVAAMNETKRLAEIIRLEQLL